jgi:hypothetical protein
MCTLKSLDKEFIVANDLASWDLLVLDDEGVELKRISGTGDGAPGYARAIKTRYCDDCDFVMWMKSPTEMSIVDMGDFSEKPLENFWKYQGHDVYGTTVAANVDATKIVGVGFVPGMKNIQTLHIWENGEELTVVEMRSIHKDVAAWLSVELSKDSNTIFVGGSQNLDMNTGDAFIFALNFHKDSKILGHKRYSPKEIDINCINEIRRHSNTEIADDVLILGGSKHILVTLYSNNCFHTIQDIQTFSQNPICDLAMSENNLYAVCGLKKAMCCYFDPKAAELEQKVKIEIEQSKALHIINQPIPTESRDISNNVTGRSHKPTMTG